MGSSRLADTRHVDLVRRRLVRGRREMLMGGVVRVGNAGMVEAVGVRSRWGGVDSLSLLLLPGGVSDLLLGSLARDELGGVEGDGSF
jgi:hypothetical protein